MADFNTILQDINNGVAGFAQALPTISANGIASVQGLSAAVAGAGAAAAASTSDQERQNEIVASTQTALVLIPLIFNLFHKKK